MTPRGGRLRDERGRLLGNPLRSEAAAFRWVVAVAVVAVVVVLVSLLLRALT